MTEWTGWLKHLSPKRYIKLLDWYIIKKFIGTYIYSIALIISICNIASVELPDPVKRALGVIGLLALPVVAYSSMKLRIWEKRDKQD